jgi:ribosomal-protein-alanine N-acetyltransferase
VNILETERLVLREIDSAIDAEFIFRLLNSPKFLKYIGDRGVRSVAEATAFIENRYRQSYRDHGYGLYTVCLKTDRTQIGICGFVKRDTLPDPDIGFAFLPEYERSGFGFESAAATLELGREKLGIGRVLAITSTDNDASGNLLIKLGFAFDRLLETGDEILKVYRLDFLTREF